MDEKIAADSQKSDVGELVELFVFDATVLGDASSPYYFCEASRNGGAVVWQAKTYIPIDVSAEGFGTVGKGPGERPKIRIANTALALASAVSTYNDLLGATITRKLTLSKYLDGEAEADPDAHYPDQLFRIEQKTAQNKLYIEWELISFADFTGLKIPRRVVLRDICTQRYRTYNESAGFDYTDATCPYTGSSYWDRTGGTVSDPGADECGKRLSDCELRFTTGDLYTWAFPGIAKVRL